MDLSNKLLWFLIMLCFCITAPSCRSMKKQLSKSKGKTESELSQLQTGKLTFTDSSRRDWSEQIEFNFKLDPPKFPEDRKRAKKQDEKQGQETQDFFDTTPPGVSPEAWAGLLSRVRELNVKISRQETEQKLIRKDSAGTLETNKKENSSFQNSDLDKSTDSTLGANVPWFAWIIGALLIFGMFAFALKKLKPW